MAVEELTQYAWASIDCIRNYQIESESCVCILPDSVEAVLAERCDGSQSADPARPFKS